MIVVIGGGAGGYFSAIHARIHAPDRPVLILEKSHRVLEKVRISGGGRCNVTHDCMSARELASHYPRGQKALLGAFSRFNASDTWEWFKSRGVLLKVEQDGRVFPQSNSSSSIMECLMNEASELGVELRLGAGVSRITYNKSADALVRFTIHLDTGDSFNSERVVLATGSARGGYELARGLGHTIVPPIPSLFTFKVADKALHALSGLSVADAEVWLDKAPKQRQRGPVLVTHWGLSGPAVIKLSAWQAEALHGASYAGLVRVNWLAAYSHSDAMSLLLDFQSYSPRSHVGRKSPFSGIPQRLWFYLVHCVGLAGMMWSEMNETQFTRLLSQLQMFPFTISGKGQFKEEFVTCGGVDLNEINFKRMESRLCQGLHVVGELLNIDGETGGFNFQNAWTTGYLAGCASASGLS